MGFDSFLSSGGVVGFEEGVTPGISSNFKFFINIFFFSFFSSLGVVGFECVFQGSPRVSLGS